jgi:hypothetical protein
MSDTKNGIVVYQGTNIQQMKQDLLRTNNHRTLVGVRICQDKIGDDFVRQAIERADILVVNYSNSDIIGFAAVTTHNHKKTGKYLYIDLICNEPPRPMQTREMGIYIRYGAKAMLDAIETLAMTNGCFCVKLSAIDSVIPYYYRFGYNFERVFIDGEDINTYLQTKQQQLITELRQAQIEDDTEEQDRIMIQIIKRFYIGFYSDSYQDQASSSDSTADRTRLADTNGIPMIKMIRTSPTAALAAIGGKKHKKKTIRNKYTKKRAMLKKSRKYRRRV